MAELGRLIGGRYRLIELRGESDVATVYRATDVELNRDVIVNVIRPEFGKDQDFVAEYRLQVRAAAAIDNPNVVAIYAFGSDADGTYVVTEYLYGQDLGLLLEHNGPVPPRRAASVTATVSAALASAHARGVVHGDLRSGNVIVSRDGAIKIGDFGFARALAESDAQAPEMSVQAAWYQSPEQARGRKATDASDVYALGVLLFELLTGHGPWDGATAAEVAAARTAQPDPAPSQFQMGIPADMDAIARKAMAVDPRARFESSAALADALEASIERLDAAPAAAPFESFAPEPEPQPASPARYAAVVPPAAAIPVSPFAPPPVPVPPTAPLLRRPNPTTRVNYSSDAYATGAADTDDFPAEPRVQSGYSPEAARRTTRRINPIEAEAAPDDSDDPPPASMWVWVAGFLALLFVTLLGLLVFLLISRNSSSNNVVYAPDLTNLTYINAQAIARNDGLQLTPNYVTNTTNLPPNTISDQAPAAGSPMQKGDTITVTVVGGVGVALVPSLVNLTETDAKNALTAAGLVLGSRGQAYDPSIPEGQVVSSNPRAGVSVQKGSSVDYVVSKGPQPTPSPTPSPSPSPTPTPTPPPTLTPTPTPTPAPTPTPTPAPTV